MPFAARPRRCRSPGARASWRAAAVDQRRRVGIDRLGGDVRVPRVVGRKNGSRTSGASTVPPPPPLPFLASAVMSGPRVESPAQATPNARRLPSLDCGLATHWGIPFRGWCTRSASVCFGPLTTTATRRVAVGLPHAPREAGVSFGGCITSRDSCRPEVGRDVRLRDDPSSDRVWSVARNALCALRLPEP